MHRGVHPPSGWLQWVGRQPSWRHEFRRMSPSSWSYFQASLEFPLTPVLLRSSVHPERLDACTLTTLCTLWISRGSLSSDARVGGGIPGSRSDGGQLAVGVRSAQRPSLRPPWPPRAGVAMLTPQERRDHIPESPLGRPVSRNLHLGVFVPETSLKFFWKMALFRFCGTAVVLASVP